jgi:3-deoxy-7-phosphoheptulonate synthase
MMIIVFEAHATEEQIRAAQAKVEALNLAAHRSDGVDRTVLGLVGDIGQIDPRKFELLAGVHQVLRISSPFKLASRDFHPENTIVQVGEVSIGGTEVVLIAGPCAVESEEMIHQTARAVAGAGARLLRGGAFKPRTSPYSFRGMGEEGLQFLRAAADEYGLAVVTEVMTIEQIPIVAEYADLLQVGTRNMQNFPLLVELGKVKKPVLLKRGLAATINDWLMSAEYILSEGNPDVILCERGIRTFETATRNTMDLSAVPVIQHLSHLPIVCDPSHGTGFRRYVAPLARASVAAGADGVMVEVHPDPDNATSDGPQTLTFDEFTALANRCRIIATTLGRRIAKGRAHG